MPLAQSRVSENTIRNSFSTYTGRWALTQITSSMSGTINSSGGSIVKSLLRESVDDVKYFGDRNSTVCCEILRVHAQHDSK